MLGFGALGQNALGRSVEAAKELTVSFSISEAPDTVAISAGITASASLAVTEARDTASFTAGITASASLAVTEARDTASFTAGITASASLFVTEPLDTVSVTVYATINVTLEVTEPTDTVSFTSTLFGREVIFSINELPDVARFRSFIADYFFGEAETICVPGERRVLAALQEDRHITIAPKEDVVEATIYVLAENRYITVPPKPFARDVPQEDRWMTAETRKRAC